MLVKKLPFEFFIYPKLKMTLFPTLIAACYQDEDNRSLMEEDISMKLLATFATDSMDGGVVYGGRSLFASFGHLLHDFSAGLL